jgi:hypothetical protein
MSKYEIVSPAKNTVTLAATPEPISAEHIYAKDLKVTASPSTVELRVGRDANTSVSNEVGELAYATNTINVGDGFLDEIFVGVSIDGETYSYSYKQKKSLL